MNTTLWVIQGLTAAILTGSGVIILTLPKKQLAKKLSWINKYSDGMRYFICISKILGAAGLIVPMYFGFFPILTPIAAYFIALFMIFAMRYHFITKEYKDVPATILFFIAALFIAYHRF